MIIKVTAGYYVDIIIHDFPKGEIRDVNRTITELLDCDWYERVRPRRLVDNWEIDNISMLVDEEGLLKPNALNYIGTWLYGAPIMGNALFITEKMTEDGPEFCGLSEDQMETLIKKMTEFFDNEKVILFRLRDETA